MWPFRGRNNQGPLGDGEPFTFLGQGAKFHGNITFEGSIRIDASLEGEIRTKGSVVVGEHAVIHGDVIADIVISGGKITGNVTASKKVYLLATAVINGAVKTPVLSVDEGVRFMGNCEAEGRGEVRALEGPREATGGVARARGMG
jgi:cytoskeletal protein CcmA (bactofilin family)